MLILTGYTIIYPIIEALRRWEGGKNVKELNAVQVRMLADVP